jgi:hypothetical protein
MSTSHVSTRQRRGTINTEETDPETNGFTGRIIGTHPFIIL